MRGHVQLPTSTAQLPGHSGGDVANLTVECVADVAAGVKRRAPILVDGGFRRGTDVYKALALGATAVGIGRPYIWGLASFGQEGVEAVLTILRRELELIMRQSGTTSISRITPAHIIAR